MAEGVSSDEGLTKGQVAEWFISNESIITSDNVVQSFCAKFDLDYEESKGVQGKAMLVKLGRLKRSYAQKKREGSCAKKGHTLKDFAAEQFEMPHLSARSHGGHSLLDKNEELVHENKTLKRQLESADELKRKCGVQEESLKEMSESLEKIILEKRVVEKDISQLKQQIIQNEAERTTLETRLAEIMHHEKQNRLLNKKLKYRDVQLSKCKDSVENLKAVNKTLLDENVKLKKNKEKLEYDVMSVSEKLKSTLSMHRGLNKEKKKLLKRIDELRGRLQSSTEKDIKQLEEQSEVLRGEVETLRTENKELEQLVALLQDESVVTFADGRFTDEIRVVIMHLVSLGVSINKVNDVISVVLRTLTNKDVEKIRLPSDGTKKKIMEEARILAQMQVAEEMLKEGDSVLGNVLHGDGTSKYHRKYQNFQITTKDKKTLSFGLGEMAGADAAATLKEFTFIADEISRSISEKAEEDSNVEISFAKLLKSITSTMSDQGPINPIFNAQLKVLRENVLPTAVGNWSSLSATEKEDVKKMTHYFCKLHLLANFGTETDNNLKELEQILLHDDYEASFAFVTAKESGAFRLIRTACKAYHKRGCDKSGVADHFEAFLSSRGEKSQLASFIGNRFNIIYHNAAAVYYHRDAIKEFYQAWPNKNNLLSAVDEDLANRLFLAEIRALGMIDKIVTGPFWRLVENVENILSINPYLTQMTTVLNEWRQDANPLFNGEVLFTKGSDLHYDGDLVKKDELYEELFKDSGDAEFDVMTIQALENICYAILIIVERQAADHLAGGEHYGLSEEEKARSSNVPTHNKASESDFAILDLLIRMKPRANIETLEVITMWYRNKTGDWFHQKTDAEKATLMKEAKEKAASAKERLKKKKVQLEKRKAEIMKEKQQETIDEEVKKAKKKIDAVNKLIELGVRAWTSEEEVDQEMHKIGDAKRREVLIAQLWYFRDIVLHGKKLKREYFTKSKGGVELSVEELLHKLKVLIQITLTGETTPTVKPTLKPPEERCQQVEEQKAKLKSQIFEVRLKNMMTLKKKTLLPRLIENPHLLKECRVKHFLRETKEDECVWTNGIVVGIEKVVPNTAKHVFQVKYEESAEVFLFPLLQDMIRNEMFLMDDIP